MDNEKFSPAVVRALDILEVISQGNSGLSNAYVARRLGIPKSSASSILHVLQSRGYLCRNEEDGRYKLGFNVLTLGRKLIDNSAFCELALPFMRDLVDRTDLTCHLAVLGRFEAIHLAKIVANRYLKSDSTKSVGERVPLHASSVGKALLACQQTPELQDSVLSKELRRSSPRTITARAQLLTELGKVRRHGYALDDQECRLGWRCVGAPVFDQLGCSRVAICLTGTVVDLDDSKISSLALAIKETAQRISRRFALQHVRFAI